MSGEGRDDAVGRPSESGEAPTGSDIVLDALRSVGVDLVVGLPGTQTLSVDRAVIAAPDMRYVMARHETAIPHIAWGFFEANGTPAATVTVPGPGDTNAMHGLKNALDDNVPILHISADVDPADRGKGPIHEIDPRTYDSVVKSNVIVNRPVELSNAIAMGVSAALTPPTGPVRLGIPAPYFDRPIDAPTIDIQPLRTDRLPIDRIRRAVRLLEGATRPVVLVGGGCRRSEGAVDVVFDLVDRLDAQVVCTYKGKGVFPEDDPRFLGISGGHLPVGARTVLAAADVVLALGTDFDGVGTDHWTLPMGETLIHVTLAVDDIDRGYEADLAVLADVGRFCGRLLDELSRADAPRWDGRQLGREVREEWRESLDDRGLFASESSLSSPHVLATVRAALPRDATVSTDIGGFRLWTMQGFETYAPSDFITGGSWAGMGIGLPSALGAALADGPGPVVGLTGDGGLLMCLQEMHTAVEEGLAPTLVVGNNRDYGIITNAPDQQAPDFSWSGPSFTDIAEGFGWRARRVETADDLATAVRWGISLDAPVLIDVPVDQDEPTVFECANYDSTIDV